MKGRQIKTAPKDGTLILLHYPKGGWIEGRWAVKEGMWEPIRLLSHGCGCCADSDPEPNAWAPLPTMGFFGGGGG